MYSKSKVKEFFPDFNKIKVRSCFLYKNNIFRDTIFIVPIRDMINDCTISYENHSFQSLLKEKIPPSKILKIIEIHIIISSHNKTKEKIKNNYKYNLPFFNKKDVIKYTPLKLKDRLRLVNPKIVNNYSYFKERFLSIKDIVYLRSRIARNDINCVFDFDEIYPQIVDKKSSSFMFTYCVFKSPVKSSKAISFLDSH